MSSGRYWQEITENYTKQYRVITIDLLGFGRSPKPEWSTYSLEAHTEAVIMTIQEVLGDTPFVIVGHSMGAIIASKVAKRLSVKQVQKLVLMNMPIFNSFDEARMTFMESGRLYRTLLYSSVGRFLWPLLKWGSRSYVVRLGARTYKPAVASAAHTTHTARSRSFHNTIEVTNSVKLLNSLNVPTCLVHGKYDRDIYWQNIMQHVISDMIAITRVETGHHTPLVDPSVLNRILLANY